MTRQEAERIMAEELDISSTYIPRWIRVWERLGLVKFDDPKISVVGELKEKLRNLMVEIEYRPFQGDLKIHGDRIGRLSEYGAGCVLAYIDQCGFQVVRKPVTENGVVLGP